MSERMMKGGVMLGYFNFISHKWGEGGIAECIEATGVDPGKLKEEISYPGEMDEKVLRWISETKGMDYVQELGVHAVKNLGELSYLVKFVNIRNLLMKFQENYHDTFQYGELSVLMDKAGKRSTIIMKNCNSQEESCMAWLGAFEGMMELTRTKGTVKLIKRQIDGDGYDEYLLNWS
ncbi:MAG: hypothetical protein KAJ64_05045 [Thermoplasmata archaeon]|nr:hypothetical protein [Thermoplasmata archaeon]